MKALRDDPEAGMVFSPSRLAQRYPKCGGPPMLARAGNRETPRKDAMRTCGDTRVCRILGENIILDSPQARRLFQI
jgi:hypothetical protein